jgi:ubiquinone/menaquinone biosynthesis C-methylase UbiE
MNERTLSLICDPETHEQLDLEDEALVNRSSGKRYPLLDGVPDFLDAATGQNKKYQEFYDRIAVFYDPLFNLYRWLHPKYDMRRELMDELEVPAAGRVLEVSVGTGANLPYLRADVELFGLDLSWAMLRRCRKNLRNWNRAAELYHGEAEHLPFRDEVFDVVFHVGGINFFNDRAGAIREMIRVAKPGTKIAIADETEKVVKGNYERWPVVGKYFRSRTEAVTDATELVPRDMQDVRSKEIFQGKLYCVTFRKPR